MKYSLFTTEIIKMNGFGNPPKKEPGMLFIKTFDTLGEAKQHQNYWTVNNTEKTIIIPTY